MPGLCIGEDVDGGGGQRQAVAVPEYEGRVGQAETELKAIPGPGSTAMTFAPRFRRSFVASPVPAPMSATRTPSKEKPASSSTASSNSGGYEGRFAA